MYGLATGTIFKDVEVRESKAGKVFGKVTIKSGSGDETILVRVICFDGPQLDAIRNIRSGDSIQRSRPHQTLDLRESGRMDGGRYLLADQVLPLRKTRETKPAQETAPVAVSRRSTAEIIDDNIPF